MKQYALTSALLLLCASTFGQILGNDPGEIHGNFQTDVQYYIPDSLIDARDVPEKMLMNGFANLIYTKGPFTAGLRYESYLNPINGFDPRYRGSGIPYRFATYMRDELEVTVGNYYEQFGAGLVFRSYEERGLGVDNAMDGIRLRYRPAKGVYLKGIYGRQRSFFTLGPGIVRGIDGEFNLNELLEDSASTWSTRITVGGSAISRYQSDMDSKYVLPENVSAFAGRTTVGIGNFSLQGEYAYKINDPSAINSFIYKDGSALLIGANYFQKGFGFNLSAKRVDNMDFRSDRTAIGNDLTLNFLPPITKQHTYLLLAFYPYAAQNMGEIGVQGEVFFKIPKGTAIGGKYGTDVALNYSEIHGLETVKTTPYEGYQSEFAEFGPNLYFQDANIEITKKFSRSFKGTLTLANIKNDISLQGLGTGIVNCNIVVADMTYRLNNRHSLRMELHNMTVKENKHTGSWAAALLEYTIAPKWFVTVLDQYNYGNQDLGGRVHYVLGQVAFVKNANRFSLSYGRQRAGVLCVGGICRNVPAMKGFTFTVTSSF